MTTTIQKSLPQLAAPLVVSFTLRFLFQTIDLVYAGFISDAAVAAIGLWAPFFSVFLAIWVGLSAGFTTNLSTAFGARDEARISDLKRGMRRILAWLVPVLTLVGVGVHLAIPNLGLEQDLTDAFLIYGTTLALGIPVASFWSIYPDSIVKAHQDTRSTMVAGLWSTGTNVVLNTVFVFVFGWGVFGLALATLLSRFASLAYAAARARALEQARAGDDWSTTPTRSWPNPIPSIARLSLPAGLTFVLGAVESAVVNGMLARLPDSTTAIAAFAIYDRALGLALMPILGASVAVVPFVARNVAEGRVQEVSADLRRTLLYGAIFALAFALPAGLLFPIEIGGIFIDDVSDETAGPLRLLPLAALAALPFLLLRPVFEALGLARLGITVSVCRFVVFSIPLILLGRFFADDLGVAPVIGMIWGLITATVLASGLTVWLCFPLRAPSHAATR